MVTLQSHTKLHTMYRYNTWHSSEV